ncbi:molybdenum cofactor biosynthesis protein MoaE [Luteipulveratus sp. YIM 133132]|uniref:Molybdenum cofactor biosynthesis protein MoaE n=1 Tax=Luteipulveratus flavus TaxID=3031728 RepID=A0ABT6C7Y8_9MICO|nr:MULTISPECIES: molybdenum cofactor biosynthesis protein MoaE [unclassified Luteipulveratus]MDE9365859.1 molybdenum cofactor biosynthesis protein MoaE [Luteipulveratus sp. YIM 133132]MDF8265051.1 molybdenum cofactor biosynthesis protein MoaE [Luteipulveratus sp. YIM 133296]
MSEQPIAGTDLRARLLDVRDEPLSVDEVLAAVKDPAAGGIALFVGVVRQVDHDQPVSALDYSAHPSAVDALGRAAAAVLTDEVTALAAVHRTGHLEVGDTAVVVAVSAPHRGPALEVCREMIDTLKRTVPIWKHQQFSDGSDEWVGLP